jgi:hypothetical protein
VAMAAPQYLRPTSATSLALAQAQEEKEEEAQEHGGATGAKVVVEEQPLDRRYLHHTLAKLRDAPPSAGKDGGRPLISTAMPKLYTASSVLEINPYGEMKRGQTLKEIPEATSEAFLPPGMKTATTSPATKTVQKLTRAEPSSTLKGTPFGTSTLTSAAARVLLGTLPGHGSASPLDRTAGGGAMGATRTTTNLVAAGYDQEALLAASGASAENLLQRGQLRSIPGYFRELPAATNEEARKTRPHDYYSPSSEVKFNFRVARKDEGEGSSQKKNKEKQQGDHEIAYRLAPPLPDVRDVASTLSPPPFPPYRAPGPALGGGLSRFPPSTASSMGAPASSRGEDESQGGGGYVIYTTRTADTATMETMPSGSFEPHPSPMFQSAAATAPTYPSPSSSVYVQKAEGSAAMLLSKRE